MFYVRNGDYAVVCETESQIIDYLNNQYLSYLPVGNAPADDVLYKIRYIDHRAIKDLKELFDIEIQNIEINEEFEI